MSHGGDRSPAELSAGFAGSDDGGFILPGFLPAFDAAATLVKILELVALQKTTLSEIRRGLPAVHIVHETVVTPWEQKGTVMRSLMEMTKDREHPPPVLRSPSSGTRRQCASAGSSWPGLGRFSSSTAGATTRKLSSRRSQASL